MEIEKVEIQHSNMMCMKHKQYLENDHLNCKDPGIYCKFRAACPIWFMTKKMKNM